MKNTLKTILLLSLVLVMALSLVACGNSAANADSASDVWGTLSWDYKKDTKTLTITGAGSMPDADSSDKIGWTSVRGSVENIVFKDKDGQSITEIGDYAFFGMTNLKFVTIPATVTSIGKCAFAFCSSLESISIPSGVTSIGESAFEACVALKSATLPESVTKIGDRAFAYDRALTSVIIAGKAEALPVTVFEGCSALTALTLHKDIAGFNEDVFKAAGIKDFTYVEGISENTVIVTYYKDTDGNVLRESTEITKAYGENYDISAPVIEGYTVKGASSFTGKASGEEKIENIFVYEKEVIVEETEESTEPEAAPVEDEDKGVTPDKIIALVVMGVVIVGICVGAALLIRSNKKQQSKGSTVRKNGKK